MPHRLASMGDRTRPAKGAALAGAAFTTALARGRFAFAGTIMPKFKVKCFAATKWDGKPAREIEAASAQAAAEQVCGAPLSSTGLQGQMCAQVWPIGWTDKKVLFYPRSQLSLARSPQH